MPQKPRFTKEEVINQAYEIIKNSGVGCLTARKLAQDLNCAVSPIFTLFGGMDEVKAEVLKKAKVEFINYLSESLDYVPAFKEYSLRYICYSRDNSNLYLALLEEAYSLNMKSIVEDQKDFIDSLIKSISVSMKLSIEDSKRIYERSLIETNALCYYCATSKVKISNEELAELASEFTLGYLLLMKIKNDQFDINIAKAMASSTKNMPKHK